MHVSCAIGLRLPAFAGFAPGAELTAANFGEMRKSAWPSSSDNRRGRRDRIDRRRLAKNVRQIKVPPAGIARKSANTATQQTHRP